MQSKLRYLISTLLLLASLAQSQKAPQLVFIQEVFRHGARYPENALYPQINDYFATLQMSPGELTSEGKSMHYLLGKKMYDVYWKRLFGGTPYEFSYNQSRFHVKSTNVNRTIESAQSHIYGLLEALPPLTLSQGQAKLSNPPYPGIQAKPGYVYSEKNKFYQTIPIHVDTSVMTPTQTGDFLATYLASNCPNQQDWIKENSNNPTIQQILNFPPFLAALRQLQNTLNLPKGTINSANFYKYYDTLICMKFLGKQVPELVVKPSQTKRALDYYYSLGTVMTFYYSQEQIRATSTTFFEETISNIKLAIESKENPQWVIYSAHDVTLGMILAALDLWNAQCIFENYKKNVTDPPQCVTTFPSFATIMVFQVYQHSNNTHTFKINYNERYLPIPFCNYHQECTVYKFQQWVQSWKVADVKLACGVFYKYKNEIVSSATGTALMIILIALIRLSSPNNKILRKLFALKEKSQ